MMTISRWRRIAATVAVTVVMSNWPAIAPAQGIEGNFATVGDTPLPAAALQQYLLREVQRRYYHGEVPTAEVQPLIAELANELVVRELLIEEAKRRGLAADRDRVEQRLSEEMQKLAVQQPELVPEPEQLERIRQSMSEHDMVNQLREQVAAEVVPTPSAVQGYYDANPDKFTEPERVRVGLILLGVSPESMPDTWVAADREAAGIVEKLDAGADFAGLARLHSSDPSADSGGDMGYVHAGMVGAEIEAAMADLAVGETSQPIRVLEGVAIVKLLDRTESALLPFERVAERAEGLWLRDARDGAWSDLIEELRERTPVVVDERYLDPQFLLGASH